MQDRESADRAHNNPQIWIEHTNCKHELHGSQTNKDQEAGRQNGRLSYEEEDAPRIDR